MRVHGSKAYLHRPILLAIALTCLALLSGAIQAQNRVFLWGNNSRFQLGTTPPTQTNGNTTYYGRNLPAYVRAFNILSTAAGNSNAAIACGYYHTLALKTDGTVWVWGDNSYGQLGNGSYAANSDQPVQAGLQVGLTGVIAIAASGNHSMALDGNGKVWTWGDNGYGELGNESTVAYSPIPIKVTGLPTLGRKVTAIAVGSQHCMALQDDGSVWAWGYNGYGQLGDGTHNQLSEPTRILQLSGVTKIGAGSNNSLAIAGGGAVWVWGGINTSTPAKIPGLTGVTAFSLDGFAGNSWNSRFGTPLLVSNGAIWYLTTSSGLQATQMTGVSGVSAVSGNYNFVVTLHTDGTVWCRGDNTYGEIGNTLAANPQWNWIQATGISSAVQIQAGAQHAIALDKTTGKLWSWGDNEYGQLTLPSPENQSRPTRPHITFGSVVAAAVGSNGSYAHYLFLHKDGTVWSYGSSSNGQLGDGGTTDSYATTTQVYGLSGVAQVAANRNASSFAVTGDGKLWAWGNNGNGQLGDGTTTERHSVRQVTSLTGVVKAVAPGFYHTLALMGDGTVWAWGYNGYGELGDGTTNSQDSPIQVPGLTGITAIAAGDYFSLALKNDGSVWIWGYAYPYSPTQVSGLPQVTAIAAGPYHTMALASDGTVYCWGYNYAGELGNGTTGGSYAPQQVPGLTGIKKISAGSDNDDYGQSFAIRSDNTVWTWGNDRYGQLGEGVLTPSGWNGTIAQPNPTQVFLPGVKSIISNGGVTMALVKDVEPDLKGDGTTDANGDSTTDLFLQNSATGQQQLWYMTGMTLNGQLNPFGAPISANWTLGGIADLTGNGVFDLLWQKSANSPINPGNVNAWLMNGTPTPTYVNIYPKTPAGWYLVGVTDTNNDGSPDMIWQAPDGRVKVIYLSGGKLVPDGSGNPTGGLLVPVQTTAAPNGISATWKVVGTADMDGDGYADIIAQDTQTHAVRVWYLKANAWTGAYDDLAPAQTGSNILRLASIQDLDGDSQPDLIWQASNGDVTCWQMDSIVGQLGQPILIQNAVGWSVARAH